MSISRALTATAVLVVSVSVAQAGAVTGKCDGGKCDAFEVVERSQVKRDAVHGEELVIARIKSWVQDSEKRTAEAEETGYVFCSKARPAMLVQDSGKTLVKFLAPASRKDVEGNLNLYASYYEVCHGRGGEVAKALEGLSRELDYKVSRTASTELKEANKPESVFWWTTPDVTVARPVFVEQPTRTAQLPQTTDETGTTGSIEDSTKPAVEDTSRSVSSVDPHWRQRVARAKARMDARRIAASRARERYAVARYRQQQGRGGGREAMAYAEPEQRVVYVPVRREPQNLFRFLFGGED